LKKVLIITYYWPPAGGAGVQRWLKLCNYLLENDIQPIVITVDERVASYPLYDYSLEKELSPNIIVYRTKSFEILNLYKRLSPKKQIPYAGFTNENKSGVIQKISKFVRGNFFIPDARIGWNKHALKKAKEIILAHKIKTVITTSPPHSSQLIGLELKKSLNINWIADLRDPWTEIFYYNEFNHTNWAKRKDAFLEKTVLEKSDAIITVSDFIKQRFVSKTLQPIAKKTFVISNGYDQTDFENVQISKNNGFRMVYTGTLSNDYPISLIINALKNMSGDSKFQEMFLLDFFGNANLSIQEKFKTISNLKVKFYPHVSHSQSISELLNSEVLLLIIPQSKNNKGILTGKLFEYLASKKTIVAIGPTDGDAAKIIEQCGAGKMFDYSDTNGFLNYMNQLFSQFLENGKVESNHIDTQIKKYSRAHQAKQLVDIIGLGD
jgi:glycosyltransferase involved in cell wall biosynthesis